MSDNIETLTVDDIVADALKAAGIDDHVIEAARQHGSMFRHGAYGWTLDDRFGEIMTRREEARFDKTLATARGGHA